MEKNKRVLLGMSGGVDSSVAAILLKEQGYEVIGITMDLYKSEDSENIPIDDAKRVCNFLGIEHYTADFTEEFKDKVINNFGNHPQKAAGKRPFKGEYLWQKLLHLVKLCSV